MVRNKENSDAVCENTVDANSFEQRVEKRAYELYEKRGFVYGHEWDDWFEAEKIVEAQINTVDRDCIRSESFFKTSHRSNPLPSYLDPQNVNTSSFVKDF